MHRIIILKLPASYYQITEEVMCIYKKVNSTNLIIAM